MRANGVLTWVLSDHLGSASVTANEDGSFLSEQRYTAFGEVRLSSGETNTPYQYTGQLSQVDEIGLYYYVARWYDPYLNRFLSPDSIVPESVQGVQAWDRYAYVNNNPIKANDPTGHCIDGISTAFCIAVAVGAVVGGVASATGYIAATKMMGQEVNVKSLIVATGSGIVAGALAPIIAVTAPVAAVIPATLAMYGTVSATQYAVDQVVNDKPVDTNTAIANFGVGAFTGIIGGVYSPFDDIGREGMSQGLKIGMDFSKNTLFQGEKEAAKQFIKYQAVNGISNFVRTSTTTIVQSLAPKVWEFINRPQPSTAQ